MPSNHVALASLSASELPVVRAGEQCASSRLLHWHDYPAAINDSFFREYLRCHVRQCIEFLLCHLISLLSPSFTGLRASIIVGSGCSLIAHVGANYATALS